MKPVVSIVGRPNVGKSSLFNRILGRTKALVQDTPGVTRDRNYAVAEYERRSFILVDTGGYEDEEIAPDERKVLARIIRDAATEAVEEADVVVIVLDGKDGINPVDGDLVDAVRRSGKPVVHAVNKVDHPKHLDRLYEFYELGVEDAIPVSAAHGLGVDDTVLCRRGEGSRSYPHGRQSASRYVDPGVLCMNPTTEGFLPRARARNTEHPHHDQV